MEPQVGNIYKGGTLIGYRDPVYPHAFTAEGGTDWEFDNDKHLIDGTCVTVPAGFELQIIDGVYQKINGQYQLIEIP
jgi:hypothetical protein